MNRCDPLSETQQWIFEHINMTVIEKLSAKKPALSKEQKTNCSA